jgi:hypothetical protein
MSGINLNNSGFGVLVKRKLIFLCVSGIAMCGVPAYCQSAAGTSQSVVADVAQGDLNRDASVDVAAMSKYEVSVRGLLYERKFDDLDRIADADRSSKAKFAGGVWKLYVLYQALKVPVEGQNAPETAWEKHLNALTLWVGTNRDSVTAHVALAEALMNYTAKLQNDSSSRKVGEGKNVDSWARIREVQHMGELILKRASTLATKCPHFYFVMLEAQELRDPVMAKTHFEKAIAFEPAYFPYYRVHAVFQRPEWEGEEGQAEKFADDISKRIGGKQGAAIYFEIAAALNCSPNTQRFPVAKMSWDRIQEGYAALEELYGPSLYKMNQFAYLAIRYDQVMSASKMLERIGERGDEFTWGSITFFEYNRSWAVAPPEIVELRAKSSANVTTSEGQKYQTRIYNELGHYFIPAIRRCSGELKKGPFMGSDLFLRMSNTGQIEEVRGWPKTPFVECVMPEFKGTLSPPPVRAPNESGPYWVNISQKPGLGMEP